MGSLHVEKTPVTGSAGRFRLLIIGSAVLIAAAAVWMTVLFFKKSGAGGSGRIDYPTARTIQYSYTLQNQTNRLIEKAEFWAHAPVKQTATQRCEGVSANYPFQIITDPSGNQVLHFEFENLAPYATRIITIKANLQVSASANPIGAEPQAVDLSPERYIESDHPAIRRAAAALRQTDAIETIKAIFDRVARTVRYSGYAAEDRGALYALEHKKGDCTEYMDLFVALCRANGLPARRMGGYISPENGVIKARDYHNWGEFYEDGTWQIADPQNNVLMAQQDGYIAMRILRPSADNPLGGYNRFRHKGNGLNVRMN